MNNEQIPGGKFFSENPFSSMMLKDGFWILSNGKWEVQQTMLATTSIIRKPQRLTLPDPFPPFHLTH